MSDTKLGPGDHTVTVTDDNGCSATFKVAVNEPGVRHGGERFANYWNAANYGFADQVEIIVINDATARRRWTAKRTLVQFPSVDMRISSLSTAIR